MNTLSVPLPTLFAELEAVKVPDNTEEYGEELCSILNKSGADASLINSVKTVFESSGLYQDISALSERMRKVIQNVFTDTIKKGLLRHYAEEA